MAPLAEPLEEAVALPDDLPEEAPLVGVRDELLDLDSGNLFAQVGTASRLAP
jgi:hypothetical protein